MKDKSIRVTQSTEHTSSWGSRRLPKEDGMGSKDVSMLTFQTQMLFLTHPW